MKKNFFGLFAATLFFSDFLPRPFFADVKGTLLNPEALAARTLKQIDFEISKCDFEIQFRNSISKFASIVLFFFVSSVLCSSQPCCVCCAMCAAPSSAQSPKPKSQQHPKVFPGGPPPQY